MRIDIAKLRKAGYAVDLEIDYSKASKKDSGLIAVEINGNDDGKAREAVFKQVKASFPEAPKAFVDEVVDDLCGKLFVHTLAAHLLGSQEQNEEERKEGSRFAVRGSQDPANDKEEPNGHYDGPVGPDSDFKL